ncbi:hypothetical protein ACLOJK_011694 [Asimina triloba]
MHGLFRTLCCPADDGWLVGADGLSLHSFQNSAHAPHANFSTNTPFPYKQANANYKNKKKKRELEQEMEVKGGGDYRAHAVLLPYPSQGHVNPMLQLAKRLASKGVKVTLATTHYTVRSISAPGVGVEPISDGFDEAGFRQAPSAEAYLEEFKRSGSRTLAELMSRFELMGTPVDCIVYDSFLTWALDVARQLGALGVAFFTTSAIYASIFCRMRHGLLGPFPVTTKGQPLELPGFLPLRFEDLPTFITKPSAVFAGYWDMLLNQFSNLDEADWVLGNSLEAVDGEYDLIDVDRKGNLIIGLSGVTKASGFVKKLGIS